MSKFYSYRRMLIVVCFTFALASAAEAQATRTWVSGVGDDANPCSRTAPCKTFAGAISKTAVNGEIDCIDPGGFGAVTITKSITIDGGGTFGSILAAATTGVIVNVTALTDVRKTVVLRNISINGANSGVNGVNFIAGSKLFIESCQIFGFQASAASRAIKANLTAAAQLFVKDTDMSNNASGIDVSATTGVVVTSIDHCHLEGMTDALILGSSTGNSIRDSFITGNSGVGVKTSGGAGTIIERTLIDSNGTGLQPASGTTTDISNVSIIGNALGIATTGGTVFSHGNNQINLNTTAGAVPTGIGQQ
jgi:hypothetical protein